MHRPLLLLLLLTLPAGAQETGVTGTLIRLGSIMDLTGETRSQGVGLRAGMEAALLNHRTQNRSIELIIANDAADSNRARAQAGVLSERGLFAMIGNLGSAGTHAALPILMEQELPVIGFLSGSEVLRSSPFAINFRPSYTQEIGAVVRPALDAGLEPDDLCLLIQDDEYGLAGLRGLIDSLADHADTGDKRRELESLLALDSPPLERNHLGPLGVYPRHTERVREAYDSLKLWERTRGASCQLVITAGHHAPISAFIAYAHYKGEDWLFSALSSTGAGSFQAALNERFITDGVIQTQVVPPVDAPLPLVAQARQVLGPAMDPIALEGYIVGRLFLAIADAVEGPLTRDNFLSTARGRLFNLDGLLLDFSDDNQGSDLVLTRYLDQSEFRFMDPSQLHHQFQR